MALTGSPDPNQPRGGQFRCPGTRFKYDAVHYGPMRYRRRTALRNVPSYERPVEKLSRDLLYRVAQKTKATLIARILKTSRLIDMIFGVRHQRFFSEQPRQLYFRQLC